MDKQSLQNERQKGSTDMGTSDRDKFSLKKEQAQPGCSEL